MLMSRGRGRTLSFVVHGEKITELARDKYKESKDVDAGIDFLCRALIGFPRDLAEKVVKGSKKLVGVNEVYLEDDDTEVVPYGYIQPSDISSVECGWISPDGLCFGDADYNERPMLRRCMLAMSRLRRRRRRLWRCSVNRMEGVLL